MNPTITLSTVGKFAAKRVFRLNSHEIATHKHVIGVTGQGKSKLLASMYTQLVGQGIAAAVIDPHGDLATDCLAMLADAGKLDTVRYIDFNRRDVFVPWNILHHPHRPVNKLTGDVLEAIERAWPALGQGAAPQFENIFINAAHVLIENHLPITRLSAVVTDRDYREKLLEQVDDQNVKHFWHERFDRWTSKEATDNVETSLRRTNLISYSFFYRRARRTNEKVSANTGEVSGKMTTTRVMIKNGPRAHPVVLLPAPVPLPSVPLREERSPSVFEDKRYPKRCPM